MHIKLTKYIPFLLLAGCTSSLEELKEIAPTASDFSSSLAAEYLAYSESEAELKRSSSSEHFAEKGVRAAKGEDVEPDEVNSGIREHDTLTAARADLVDSLTVDVKHVSPQKAARAQLLFDCWNEQERHNLPMQTVPCAEEFKQLYEELRDIADSFLHGAERKSVIRFIEGSAHVDDQELAIIREIAQNFVNTPDFALELKAYKDIDGTGKLARKRLLSVKKALVDAGVPKAKIFFARESPVGKSGSEVILSNDKAMQNSDKVDITITSQKHLSAVSHE